jgi:hypothetical protein
MVPPLLTSIFFAETTLQSILSIEESNEVDDHCEQEG